ncbi:MAG TPA: hypothetical protein VI138_07250 [Candidatus Dormibacteraeota bacterium]
MITLLHPADGLIRRMVDEPWLVPDQVRRHVLGCPRCSSRWLLVTADGAAVERLLPPQAELELDPRSAWAATQRRLRTADPARRPASWARLPRRLVHPGRPAAAVGALALLLVGAGMGTAVAGVKWTQIFAPTKVAALPVTRAELLALPHLREFGRLTGTPELKLTPEPTLAAAEAAAGVTLSAPSPVPAGVTGAPHYYLVPRWSSTFTFSSARARAAALAAGVTLPALPAGFDGSRLRESVGPGVVITYGSSGESLGDLFGVRRQRSSACASGSSCKGGAPTKVSGSSVPTLALLAVKPPVLASTGVTVAELESYLLSLPFLPPSLATAIRHLGDPVTSLPIPVLSDLGQSQPTTVDGARGVLFAAASPLASAVVWEAGGVVRAVGGLVDADTSLALARG